VIALVFAMLGGAYAASGSGGAKATASKTGKRGPRGPKGATGPQGPAGINGTNGTNGKDGVNGTTGPVGAPGTNGISPSGTAFSGEANGCKEGGVKYVGTNTTVICNGTKGASGETGFTETLPSGQTETGAWSLSIQEGEGSVFTALSFPIPLRAPLQEANIHVIESGTTTACPGTAIEPKAVAVGPEEPTLCIYEQFHFGIETPEGKPVGVGGAFMQANRSEEPDTVLAFGSFAVAEG